jgi:UDPglucose 6-dehydrogenase
VRISVVGAGYVGLVTAACLARLGNVVRVLEIDQNRVDHLRRGILPIREPGLEQLVEESLDAGRLTFDSDPASIRGTRLSIVCVGTLDAEGDWTAGTVRRTVEALAADSRGPRGIVVRSTLLPGTGVMLAQAAKAIDPAVALALNPEFTREGAAVSDFMAPDRVVIGVEDPTAPSRLLDDLRRLYAPLEAPYVVTDLTSAEAIKVASNVFLATKISFANEIARLAAAMGADVQAVVDGMGLDKRIGRGFLSPGPGFGGSCFPSQSRALPELARTLGVAAPLMSSIAASNDGQADWLLDRLEIAAGGRPIAGWRVALLGLTFKADTDDLRESPALRLARRLTARGASVVCFDPLATASGVAALRAEGLDVSAADSAEAACAGADAVVVATEWPEFRVLEWREIAQQMRGNLVADARHVVDVEDATRAGLIVVAMGVVKGLGDGAAAEAGLAAPEDRLAAAGDEPLASDDAPPLTQDGVPIAATPPAVEGRLR